ncbi:MULTISPECIES: serine hydrolase domain-containing protein [unclassified Nocardioides]|uniref:serine hydrolase domain-containing protein n=1 Tax=unclassified Nocardioides TaxID=2615069 RepID=UPI003610A16B
MRRTLVAAAACLALLAPGPAGADVAAAGSEPRVDGWPTTTPAAAGFRPQRLASIAADARRLDSTCLAVVRHGRLVADWNWGTPRTVGRQTFSVTKSITSALVGIAVRDGDLRLGDRVARHVPSWRGTDSSRVTVRDLLSNTSGRFWSFESDYVALTAARDRTAYAVGLGQQHPRGTVWAYNNAAIQVLDRVLRRATGRPTDKLAADRLFGPLGMTHTTMTRDLGGRSTNVYFGVQSTCLDLARFARLYLQRGVVDGRRLLSRGWVRQSVGRSSSDLNAAYGLLWWVNRRGVLRSATDPVDADGRPIETRVGRLVPGARGSLFAALGLGGQVAMVDPASRTVVVRMGPAVTGGEYGVRDAARVVTEALR